MNEMTVSPVRHGPFSGRLEPANIAAYAAATVRRVAVRFASPTPLDSELAVNAFGIGKHSFAFEAAANGTTTITHGRLELRP